MQRTLQAADVAGIPAFPVHAKNEQARRFYLKFDFISPPSDPMHMFGSSKTSDGLSPGSNRTQRDPRASSKAAVNVSR
jgi:hypothetical protein